MDKVMLSGLIVYPVKSARGVVLQDATVGLRGLAGDRRWMVVDEQRVFLTQRSHPHLALASVADDCWRLVLTATGMTPLAVERPPAGAATVRARVWDDVCEAVPAGQEAARWFSSLLGNACELVFMPDGSYRRVAPCGDTPEAEVGFADVFPFLLISEASLEDLNRRLARPVPKDRFRPNLVVTGCDP